jgi:hypothetical protein
MAFLMHLEATIALSCTSSLPCGVAREGLALAWRSCGVSCLRCLLMPSAHSFLPTPPRNTTTTTSNTTKLAADVLNNTHNKREMPPSASR